MKEKGCYLMKNKAVKLVTGALLMGLLVTGCGKKPEGVAASVDGQDIPMEAYQTEYWMQRNYIVQQYGDKYLEENVVQGQDKTVDTALKEMVLKNLEQMEMIRQEAKDAGIEIKDEDVNQVLENMKKQYGGEEAFQKALKTEGMTEDYLKKNIKNSILMEKYSAHLQDTIKVSDDEVKKYYDKHKDELAQVDASHILVKSEDMAKKVKKELDQGAKFEDLAKKYSTDTSNKDNGGALGYFGKGQMVKEFDEKVFSMKKGEISDPVKTEFGYHIIKVNDIKDSLESMKDALSQKVKSEKVQENMKKVESKKKVKEYINFKDEVELPKGMEKVTKNDKAQDQGQNQKAKKEDK